MIWENRILVASLVAWAAAQTSKFLVQLVFKRSVDFAWFTNAGGMPSSHSAFVSCLSTMIGREVGWDSPLLAVSVVFSLIVLYDAAGVRQAAGKQAQVINKMVQDIYERHELPEQRLRELLGHTPLEVFAGIGVGVLIGLLW